MADFTDTASAVEIGALLGACAGRDQAAFQRLYEAAAPQLLACLMRILRDRAAAEDALQDVFVQVWNRAGQFRAERGNAWAWLVAIARYRAIDLRRRERRGAFDAGADIDALAGEPEALPEADFSLGERASRALAHCLDALQPRQRECIVLAYQGGLTHAEVAGRIEEPLGSVKSWIRRGLASLKRCLES
jgi:RNA polymerase sigma-70 factor (ECF subfamily)